MKRSLSSLSASLAAVAVVTGVAGYGITAATAGEAGGVRCEIRVTERGGGVSLEGVVYAKSDVDGSYRLSVKSAGGAGHSNIYQSGDFSASPAHPNHLGAVSLSGGGSYVARLEVSSSAGPASCSERVGGSL